jgi:hypothetical protein
VSGTPKATREMKIPGIGQIVKLTPKTRRGKNALQTKVNRWRVDKHTADAMCFNHEPAFFLTELRDDTRSPDIRWIQLPVDKNFDWEILT